MCHPCRRARRAYRCSHCGAPFVRSRPDSKYCSRLCMVEGRARYCEVCDKRMDAKNQTGQRTCSRECGVILRYGRPIPPVQPPSPPRIVSCDVCGETFTTRHSRAKRCSQACRGTARARGRVGVHVAKRRRVYARDGGVCHLCRGLVVFAAVRTPSSASIDHVVPWSRGGSDHMDNLATAHLWCNMLRGVASAADARAALGGAVPPSEWGDEVLFARLRASIPGATRRAWQARRPVECMPAGALLGHCRDCGVEIEHTGRKGRPRMWCVACRPQARAIAERNCA